jgi:ATPase family associated with various cellular activities (AAA)
MLEVAHWLVNSVRSQASSDTVDDGKRSVEQFGVTFKRFMDAMLALAPTESPLLGRIREHLGAEPTRLPVVVEEFDPFEQPNVQRALDDYASREGREAALLGVAAENKRFMALGLSDLLGRGGSGRPQLAEGPVDYVDYALSDGARFACVQFGLYLLCDGDARLVAFVSGPSDRMGPRVKLRLEVMCAVPEHGVAFLAGIRDGMRRLNVYRGHAVSLSPGQMGMGPQTLVAFHTLPRVRREDVVLPAGLLERVERHTVGFAEHAETLLAAGRSLKRGLLLYGPPGTGKTLTVMYLAGRMPDRTLLLTTGRGMGMIELIAAMARQLAPSMVVLEDVDLIAEERGQPYQRTGPLLFELLNEMDGLRDDRDVVFVLTTNRPDILEPALAARPGRIDLAVELPLPDAEGRRHLFELYARGLRAEDVDWPRFVERTDGASPAYIKELLRKAVLLAAEDGMSGAITDASLGAAMGELAEGGRLAERLLGVRAGAPAPGPGGGEPLPPTGGFPPRTAWRRG